MLGSSEVFKQTQEVKQPTHVGQKKGPSRAVLECKYFLDKQLSTTTLVEVATMQKQGMVVPKTSEQYHRRGLNNWSRGFL